MHRSLVRAVAALGIAASALAACSDAKTHTTTTTSTTGASTARANVDGTLRLGLLVPETGDLNVIVGSLTVAVRDVALGAINAAGGFNGRAVEIVQADDGTRAAVAADSLERLARREGVDAVIGPSSSEAAAGILDDLKRYGVLACSGSNTSAALDTANDRADGLYFRTAPSDTYQGPALAEMIANDGRSRVAIIARDDDYGTGFARSLGDALKSRGATVTASVRYDPDASDLGAAVQQAAASGPEAFTVLGLNDDGAKVVAAMIARNLGPSRVPIYTADGMRSTRFGATVNPADPGVVAGIRGTAPATAPAGTPSPFHAAFAATGVDPVFSSYYYDCTNLVVLAAVAAQSDDAEKMKEALPKLLSGQTDCDDYRTCKAALDAGETIHYRGASSPFDFWARFQPAEGTYDRWRYGADARPENFGESITVKGSAR